MPEMEVSAREMRLLKGGKSWVSLASSMYRVRLELELGPHPWRILECANGLPSWGRRSRERFNSVFYLEASDCRGHLLGYRSRARCPQCQSDTGRSAGQDWPCGYRENTDETGGTPGASDTGLLASRRIELQRWPRDLGCPRASGRVGEGQAMTKEHPIQIQATLKVK